MSAETNRNQLSPEPQRIRLSQTEIGLRYISLDPARALNTETNEGKPRYIYVRVLTPETGEMTIFQVDPAGKVEYTAYVGDEIRGKNTIGHGSIPKEEFKKMHLTIGGIFDPHVNFQHKIEEIVLVFESKNQTEQSGTEILEGSDIIDQFQEHGDYLRKALREIGSNPPNKN